MNLIASTPINESASLLSSLLSSFMIATVSGHALSGLSQLIPMGWSSELLQREIEFAIHIWRLQMTRKVWKWMTDQFHCCSRIRDQPNPESFVLTCHWFNPSSRCLQITVQAKNIGWLKKIQSEISCTHLRIWNSRQSVGIFWVFKWVDLSNVFTPKKPS